MCSNVKLFFYRFDFIGIIPQFRILKSDSYKSIVSTIISIIIALTSIGFSIYTIIDYLKFNNPSISYLIRNNYKSNNTIFLKDTLLMFKFYRSYTDSNEADLDFMIYYFNGSNYIELNFDHCQIGKNINLNLKMFLKKENMIE